MAWLPLTFLCDLLGTITVLSNMNEFIFSLFPFIGAGIILTSNYYLFYQRDKVTYILDNLKQLVYKRAEEEYSAKIILKCSKKVLTIILSLWYSGFLALFCYTGWPLWSAVKNISGETVKKPFALNSWYPCDKTAYPYYQLIAAYEFFRLLFNMSSAVGYDSLLLSSLFYMINLYDILSNKFENIVAFAAVRAKDNLAIGPGGHCEYAGLYRQELCRL